MDLRAVREPGSVTRGPGPVHASSPTNVEIGNVKPSSYVINITCDREARKRAALARGLRMRFLTKRILKFTNRLVCLVYINTRFDVALTTEVHITTSPIPTC